MSITTIIILLGISLFLTSYDKPILASFETIKVYLGRKLEVTEGDQLFNVMNNLLKTSYLLLKRGIQIGIIVYLLFLSYDSLGMNKTVLIGLALIIANGKPLL